MAEPIRDAAFYSREYNNRKLVPDHGQIFARWSAESAKARNTMTCYLDRRYGEMPGRLDALYLQATTACLLTIVVTQVVNVFLCRHASKSLLAFGLVSNRLLLVGIAVEIALLVFIVYVPLGHWLFGTAPVGRDVWLAALAGAECMGLCEEVRKAWRRRVARPLKRT